MIDRQELMKLLIAKDVASFTLRGNPETFRQELADAILKLENPSSAFNVPRGMYRNRVGAELHVLGYVGKRTGVRIGEFETLGGDISYAEARDDLFGTRPYLVTEASLKACSYELVEPAEN